MTLTQIIEQAKTKAERSGETVYVVQRDDHPLWPGTTYFYAIKASEKRRWTEGESLRVVVGAPQP